MTAVVQRSIYIHSRDSGGGVSYDSTVIKSYAGRRWSLQVLCRILCKETEAITDVCIPRCKRPVLCMAPSFYLGHKVPVTLSRR